MIIFEKVDKTYAFADGGCNRVFENLTFTVPDGSVAALMGKSGVGKTTVLRMISGLEHPDTGTVSADCQCSLAFQENRLVETATAALNLQMIFPHSVKGWKKQGEYVCIENEICNTLSDLFADYVSIRNLPVSGYSEGMKKRVEVARALVYCDYLTGQNGGRGILLLDEPFNGLDRHMHEQLADYIFAWKQLHKDATIIFTTHDLCDVEMLSASVIDLDAKTECL